MDAVTTGRRQCRMAAREAARSVHCMILPPNALPSTLASPGMTSSVSSTRDPEAGFPPSMAGGR